MTVNNPAQEINTAISSWSGFVYQGKAALFHTLSLIVEDRDAASNYDLQLDYLEDFAVLSSSRPISLHQVKAKKAETYGTYSPDIAKLKQKADDQSCDKAYFHTAKKITNKTPKEINDESPPVQIYNYDGEDFCNVDKIDQKIEAKIQQLFSGDPIRGTSEYALICRNHLDQVILGQLFKIHGMIHESLKSETDAANEETIPFSKFLEILDDPDLHQKGQSATYWLYVLLNDMYQYYESFCFDKDGDLTPTDLEKLSRYMQALRNLDENQIVQFIRNITPHRKVSISSLSDYKDATFNRDEFRFAFLMTLHVLVETKLTSDNLLQWNKDGDSFFPTTIVTGQTNAKDVCVQILENFKENDLEVLFERSHLITASINVESIRDAAPSIISTEGMSEMDNAEHKISKIKKVSLICQATAASKIND